MNEIQMREYQKIGEIRKLTPEIVDWFFNEKRCFRCFRDMERAEKICRMKLQGKTYKEIGAAIERTQGIARETVRKVLRYYKSAKYRNLTKIKPSNKEHIQNMNTRELAEFLYRADIICFETCEKAGDMYKCPFYDNVDDVQESGCIQCYMKYLESESDTE